MSVLDTIAESAARLTLQSTLVDEAYNFHKIGRAHV